MDFTTEEISGVAVARLKGVLDSPGVVRLQENAETMLLGRERKVVLDLSEVDALDPMGLAELLKLSRWVQDEGKRLRVAHAAPHVEEAFRENNISDVDFFKDVDSATKFAEELAPAPLPEPTPAPAAMPPRPKTPLWKKYWWVGAAALVFVVVVLVILLVVPKSGGKKVAFYKQDGGGNWVEWDGGIEVLLKPGAKKNVVLRVENVASVLKPSDEDWVQWQQKADSKAKAVTVTYTFSPGAAFKPNDTSFWVIGLDKKRRRSPKVYYESEVVEQPATSELPVFEFAGREPEGLEGKGYFILNPGTQGQAYADEVTATGGRVRYSPTDLGYGLKLDPITGKITGRDPKPTEKEDVEIKITATNDQGKSATIMGLLSIEKREEPGSAGAAAKEFEKQIDERFKFLNVKPHEKELLLRYKDMVLRNPEKSRIHKFPTVFFELGKNELSLASRRALDDEFGAQAFREMAGEKGTHFFVLGFADKGKTKPSINEALIRRRSEAVRAYLLAHLKEAPYSLSAAELGKRVTIIPMRPVEDNAEGGVQIFNDRKRARAAEVWMVIPP